MIITRYLCKYMGGYKLILRISSILAPHLLIHDKIRYVELTQLAQQQRMQKRSSSVVNQGISSQIGGANLGVVGGSTIGLAGSRVAGTSLPNFADCGMPCLLFLMLFPFY